MAGKTEALLVDRIEGRGVALRGHDVDTDRIIPARFLRSVSFDGLEAHVFEDDRRAAETRAAVHPFSNAAYREASILLVNRNFGCGSSREHAPQALMRWGIRAVVGESFSEIFFGNAVALGMPCFTVTSDVIERLMEEVEGTPTRVLTASVSDLTVGTTGWRAPARLPPAAQEAFLRGAWDATALLLDDEADVRAVARRLPYVGGF